MGYLRVIPRDLFNEASLLKCLGQVYLNLEWNRYDAELVGADLKDGFDIQMDPGSGAIYVANIRLRVRRQLCTFHRPLNARSNYPLYLTTDGDEEIDVFQDNGNFTPEMFTFLKG